MDKLISGMTSFDHSMHGLKGLKPESRVPARGGWGTWLRKIHSWHLSFMKTAGKVKNVFFLWDELISCFNNQSGAKWVKVNICIFVTVGDFTTLHEFFCRLVEQSRTSLYLDLLPSLAHWNRQQNMVRSNWFLFNDTKVIQLWRQAEEVKTANNEISRKNLCFSIVDHLQRKRCNCPSLCWMVGMHFEQQKMYHSSERPLGKMPERFKLKPSWTKGEERRPLVALQCVRGFSFVSYFHISFINSFTLVSQTKGKKEDPSRPREAFH